jgi:hypothetical protein
LTTEETATPNRAAAARQLSPFDTAATTRLRKSLERGLTIGYWPPSSQHLESQLMRKRNPSRFNQLVNRSSRLLKNFAALAKLSLLLVVDFDDAPAVGRAFAKPASWPLAGLRHQLG